MYDAKSEPNEFVGDTRDEAVTKATRFYGVEESDLTVKEPPPGDIFGLGARSVVVAFPKDMKPGARGGSDRGGRGERSERGERSRGRDRERGRGRGGERGGSDRDSGRRPERESRTSEEAPAQAPPKRSAGPSKGSASGEISELGKYVLGLVERMQLGAFELGETEEGDFVVLELRGEAADALSSGDNRVIGAIQLLVNQAAMQASDTPMRVVLDCGGDEDERESFLERQAGRAAKRALDTGRAVALDPMNGRDRRALHMAVREIDDVVTMSVGTGRYRQVVIVPKGADEYEEAVQSAKEAQERDRDRD